LELENKNKNVQKEMKNQNLFLPNVSFGLEGHSSFNSGLDSFDWFSLAGLVVVQEPLTLYHSLGSRIINFSPRLLGVFSNFMLE
jgi:hypothetical protein